MKSILFLSTALSLAIAAPLSARTWTDAATGRTIDGTYVSADADHVVIEAKGGIMSSNWIISGSKMTLPRWRECQPVPAKAC